MTRRLIIWSVCCCMLLTQYNAFGQEPTGTYGEGNYTLKKDSGKIIEYLECTLDGNNYKVEMTDDHITSLSINNTLVPEQQYGQYKESMEKLRKRFYSLRLKAKRDMESANIAAQRAARDEERSTVERKEAL